MTEEVRVIFPHVSPKFAEIVGQGEFLPSFFDLVDGTYTDEYAEKVSKLPRFQVEARPLEIPSELLTLPPDAEVVFRENGADQVVLSGHVRSIFEATIKRQAEGFFELSEAAEILAECCVDVNGMQVSVEGFFKDMNEAFADGSLTMFRPRKTVVVPGAEPEDFSPYITTPAAINAWLEKTGSPHRFPSIAGESGSSLKKNERRETAPELHIRLLREALVSVGFRHDALPVVVRGQRNPLKAKLKKICVPKLMEIDAFLKAWVELNRR